MIAIYAMTARIAELSDVLCDEGIHGFDDKIIRILDTPVSVIVPLSFPMRVHG